MTVENSTDTQGPTSPASGKHRQSVWHEALCAEAPLLRPLEYEWLLPKMAKQPAFDQEAAVVALLP